MESLKKITNLIITLVAIAAVIYKYFLYVDLENDCVIKLMPSYQPSSWDTKEVIALIKVSSPEDYKYMCKKVKTINKNIGCGGFDGGCFYTNKPETIFIGNDQNNLALTAAIMIHEMCHLRQADTGADMQEPPCYKESSEYLSKVVVF